MANITLNRTRGAWAGLWLAAVCAIGVVPSALARDIAPDEFQALSPLCQAVFGSQGARSERLAPFEHQLAGSCGIHHTCNGELFSIRYAKVAFKPAPAGDDKARKRFERNRKYLLGKAAGEYSYEIRCAPPTYPLLPMILTERGRLRSLQDRHAEAMKDFARALELDPNYAAARQGMAAAQIRMTLPKPTR